MGIIKQLKWRYATKKFDTTKKLSNKKLEILKHAFNLTATSFGLQTIKMVVLQDQTLRASLIPYAYKQKQVLEASHLLIICIQNDISEDDIVSYYNAIKSTRDTSETILKPYREDLIKTMGKMSVSERQQWSKNQAYIALGNLMTVCAVEGIDACPMEGFIPSKFDELLKLSDKGLTSVLLLPVGYRATDDIFSAFKKVRKPIDEAVIEL